MSCAPTAATCSPGCGRVSCSPLDRLFGMRGLLLDTAGANPMSPTMQIAYLTPQAAEHLQHALSKRLARSALRW